jgi:MORN repeat protein
MKTKIIVFLILGLFTFYQIYAQGIPSPKVPGTTKSDPDCESGDCQNGWGKKNFDYGYYEGFWKNGDRHGYGLFDWTSSGNYIGFWNNDEMDGYGCYLGEDKDLIGQYVSGSLHGYGHTREIETNKWVYGYFQNYLVEDEYTFYDNDISTGCIAGDCQSKYGRYKWSNGDTFTGFFQNGKMFMGTYLFATGDKYEGMFNKENQFHGEGRFFFEDGSYYGGGWYNGQQSGRGYYHNSSYERQIGEWSNGNLVRSLN